MRDSEEIKGDPRRVKVFLTTDSPVIRRKVERELGDRERFPLPAAAVTSSTSPPEAREEEVEESDLSSPLSHTTGGVRVISVQEGEVAHCGPGRTTSREGVLRMLTEWFILKKTDVTFVTAWSLFGASSVEGKAEDTIFRIDASNCGKRNAKPCQMQH